MQHVHLQVTGYPDSDGVERARLARRLGEELRGRGVRDVAPAAADESPGAKGSALEWAQLVVTLVGSLAPLVGVVRGWLDRHPGASITLEIDGDELTLNDATPAQQRELIDLWMGRHGR